MKKLIKETVEVIRWEQYENDKKGTYQKKIKTGYDNGKKLIMEIPSGITDEDLYKMMTLAKKEKVSMLIVRPQFREVEVLDSVDVSIEYSIKDIDMKKIKYEAMAYSVRELLN